MQSTDTGTKADSPTQDTPAVQNDSAKPKVKKALRAPHKNTAFIPDEEKEKEQKEEAESKPVEQEKPSQQNSLMEDLKLAANPLSRHAVSGTSAAYMPMMPFQVPLMMPQMQMPMAVFGMPGMMNMAMPTVPQQPVAQQTGHGEEDMNMMYQTLINSGMLNVNPKVYNQLTPGEQLQMNLQMQPGLQQYADELTGMNQEDLADMYENMLMQEYASRPEHSFGDHSRNHTYSDLNEEDFEDGFGEENSHGENPADWATDPETAKRHEEIRKNFNNPEFKDCPCCKGFISNCGGEICKNLGVCHCVVRKQNEETTDTNENDQILECKNCECCKGFVYKCDCVTAKGNTSCKCTS